MAMKSLNLNCRDCGTSIWFYGSSVTEIVEKIDASGWVDDPDGDWCPVCFLKGDDEEHGESE